MGVSHAIYGRDLEDGSPADGLIGGDPKKQAADIRRALRLAFILYGGIRYAMRGDHKKAYADKGRLPRAIGIQRQSYMK